MKTKMKRLLKFASIALGIFCVFALMLSNNDAKVQLLNVYDVEMVAGDQFFPDAELQGPDEVWLEDAPVYIVEMTMDATKKGTTGLLHRHNTVLVNARVDAASEANMISWRTESPPLISNTTSFNTGILYLNEENISMMAILDKNVDDVWVEDVQAFIVEGTVETTKGTTVLAQMDNAVLVNDLVNAASEAYFEEYGNVLPPLISNTTSSNTGILLNNESTSMMTNLEQDVESSEVKFCIPVPPFLTCMEVRRLCDTFPMDSDVENNDDPQPNQWTLLSTA